VLGFVLRRVLWMGRAASRDQLPDLRDLYTLPAADPAALRAGRQPTPELLASIRHTLGLDNPTSTRPSTCLTAC